MIEFLEGIVIDKQPTHVVIQCGGVGYIANITLISYSQIPQVGSTTKIYIHQNIRDDAHILFGFYEVAEREIFRQLITVNGVGPSTARIMLSSLTYSEVIDAILMQNAGLLQTVKGIGAKTSQRIIIELKDKIGKIGIESENILTPLHNTNKEQALTALVNLGFSKNTSETTLAKIIKANGDLGVEELIKNALKMM